MAEAIVSWSGLRSRMADRLLSLARGAQPEDDALGPFGRAGVDRGYIRAALAGSCSERGVAKRTSGNAPSTRWAYIRVMRWHDEARLWSRWRGRARSLIGSFCSLAL